MAITVALSAGLRAFITDGLQRGRPTAALIDSPTGANVAVDRRNSDGMFFRLREDPFIAQLDERLAAIMNGPPENSEGLQVLHYRAGGVYPPHFDFLVPRTQRLHAPSRAAASA